MAADTYISNVVPYGHYNDTDTIYGVVRNMSSQARDVANGAWDTFSGADMGDYDISAGTPSGSLWVGDFPVEAVNGFYIYQMRIRAGGSPATGDEVVFNLKGYWNGAVFANLELDATGRINVGSWLGQVVTLSGGNKPDVNVDEISDDATAPDTLELIVENAKGADHKLLISSDAQDLSATLDVNTKLVVGATPITLAQINAECDTAISDANLNLLAVSGTTRDDNTAATTTVIYTELSETTADHYNNMTMLSTSGATLGQARRITDYSHDATDGIITVYPAFTEAPDDNSTFVIVTPYFYMPLAGALEITYTVKKDDEDTGDPIDGVEVWITTDAGGTNVIWSGTTNSSGVLKETTGDSKPFLDAGTYYFWRRKSGYAFSNPDTEVFA